MRVPFAPTPTRRAEPEDDRVSVWSDLGAAAAWPLGVLTAVFAATQLAGALLTGR